MELLNHMEILCLTCGGTSKQLSAVAEPFYIPTSIMSVPSLYNLANTCYFPLGWFIVCFFFFFFHYNHSSGWEVVVHFGFDLHFPID